MSNNLEWLKETKIQYAPDINSHYNMLSPIVIPVKRALRKLFKFIGIPLVEEINEYHSRLIFETESQRVSAGEEANALRLMIAENRQELESQRINTGEEANALRLMISENRQEIESQRINAGEEVNALRLMIAENRREIESQRINAGEEVNALRLMIAENRREIEVLRTENDELYHLNQINENLLKLLMNPKTLSKVGDDKNTYLAMIDERDTDPVTMALRSGNCGEIEKKLAYMFPERNHKFFIDLGGNLGIFSLFMGANGWSGYAFEASAHNAELLRNSIALNSYNIRVFNKAISSYTGSLYFSSNGPWGLVVNNPDPETTYEELPCVALDDMLDDEFKEVERIDLIKIDIEGSEPAALRGMKRFLAKYDYPPIFMEVNAYTLLLFHETPMSLLKLADEQGYKAYTIEDDNTIAPLEYNRFPTVMLFDVLLLKEIPSNLPYNITEKARPDDNTVIEWIADQLENMENWQLDERYKFYILYALKDFPLYYCDERIHPYLKNGIYKKKLSEHPSLSFVADWIKGIKKSLV